uniref:Uncharacterized protein n=1 Tax=Rhizophora mucronata TaxID=61149 RepID=A0A2P2JTS6_RHIMU
MKSSATPQSETIHLIGINLETGIEIQRAAYKDMRISILVNPNNNNNNSKNKFH